MAAQKIRIMNSQDLNQFYDLRYMALEISPHSYGNHLEIWQKSSKEGVLSMLQDSASDSDNYILGSFQEQQLTGMLGLIRERKLNVAHKGTLWGFFVSPEYRNQGVGTQLVKEGLNLAQRMKDLNHLRLIVTEIDEIAKKIFEAQGFQSYGIEEAGLKSQGCFYNQIFMSKKL